MRSTAKSFRISIGLFGRRNVGKSSLLNAITRQNVSIVSEVAGTTTDPVEKPMELQPLGPVLFVDTAGVDDEGALGAQRIERTRQVIARTGIAVLVAEAGVWSGFEQRLLDELLARGLPTLVALNKCDISAPALAVLDELARRNTAHCVVSALNGHGIDGLRSALAALAPERAAEPAVILRDLVKPGQLAVLVTPIDREAPKGRIKQLQVQSIRDLLDGDASCIVVKETGLPGALRMLRTPPRLVVTDAQVFASVARNTPEDVPLTAFSILFSRLKGDLVRQTRAALTIDSLAPGDHILIAESCTHHPVEDDIGRVKIPQLLSKRVGGPLEMTTVQGRDFPADLSPFRLVIHCGACMWTRTEMLARIGDCVRQHTPITNYGLVIAHSLGILERALEPFPDALAAYREERANPLISAATAVEAHA
jgi:[FeFe] hydrogenase H-cluster maturation GTPase HydF